MQHRYFKKKWDESRGDDYDAWGPAVYYFEIDGASGYPLRQMEVYDNGVMLAYDERHWHDQFGGLGDQPLPIEEEFLDFEISQDDFESAWTSARPVNRTQWPDL